MVLKHLVCITKGRERKRGRHESGVGDTARAVDGDVSLRLLTFEWRNDNDPVILTIAKTSALRGEAERETLLY